MNGESGESRLRVLFMSDHLGYPGNVIHGATTYFLQVLPALNRAEQVDLTVCFLRRWHEAATRLQADGVEPIFLGRHRWSVRVLADLVRLVRQRGIDVIHAAGVKGMLMARLAARRTGAACFIHLHDLTPLHPVMRTAQRALAPWTDGAFGISGPVCQHAVDEFGMPAERVHVMHNPLALEPYQARQAERRRAMRASLGLNERTPVAAIVGRFHPVKGQRLAVRAMAQVHRRVPGAVLLLAGDGPTRLECEALARELGVAHAVRFLGHRDDVPDLLQAIDVLLMSAESEGLGYAAIEALAAGRPIVACAVGGLPEVVRDGETGLLAPPGDEAALVEQLTRVLSDAPLRQRLGRSAKEHARAFDVSHHVRMLTDFYRQAASDKRSASHLPAPAARDAAA